MSTLLQASANPSKARVVGYWMCTVLIAFSFVSGGLGQVMRAPPVIQGMTHLGYPVYFLVMLGVWKVLGGIVVLIPGFPLVKEWAYAGMVFDSDLRVRLWGRHRGRRATHPRPASADGGRRGVVGASPRVPQADAGLTGTNAGRDAQAIERRVHAALAGVFTGRRPGEPASLPLAQIVGPDVDSAGCRLTSL